MGIYYDFAVKYDPEVDTPEDLTDRILYSIIIKRIKAKKPVVMFISAESGEGKSLTALRLQMKLMQLQGLNFREHMENINIFTPLEYSKKFDKLLFDKELKKVNIICMHEAREIVKAKKWHTFLNQSVADVNAMSRSIKRFCFLIISQFIRDISTDIRYTLSYYCKVSRPIGHKARLSISVMWKDDKDLEKPKLRKRRLKGYIIDKKGKYRLFQPTYLEITKPPKDIVKKFEKLDYDAKAKIIRRKLERLVQEMQIDVDLSSKKVETMVEWYMKNQDSLTLIGKRYRGKWKLKPEVKLMHGLTDQEVKDFDEKLNQQMKKKGMI